MNNIYEWRMRDNGQWRGAVQSIVGRRYGTAKINFFFIFKFIGTLSVPINALKSNVDRFTAFQDRHFWFSFFSRSLPVPSFALLLSLSSLFIAHYHLQRFKMHLCQQVLIKSERIRFYSRLFFLSLSLSLSPLPLFVFNSCAFALFCSSSTPLCRCIPCATANEYNMWQWRARASTRTAYDVVECWQNEAQRMHEEKRGISTAEHKMRGNRDVREKYRHSSIGRIFSFLLPVACCPLLTVSAIDSIYLCSLCRPTDRPANILCLVRCSFN